MWTDDFLDILLNSLQDLSRVVAFNFQTETTFDENGSGPLMKDAEIAKEEKGGQKGETN